VISMRFMLATPIYLDRKGHRAAASNSSVSSSRASGPCGMPPWISRGAMNRSLRRRSRGRCAALPGTVRNVSTTGIVAASGEGVTASGRLEIEFLASKAAGYDSSPPLRLVSGPCSKLPAGGRPPA
jgi:hypothetical protein